jgi:hypothetical protein
MIGVRLASKLDGVLQTVIGDPFLGSVDRFAMVGDKLEYNGGVSPWFPLLWVSAWSECSTGEDGVAQLVVDVADGLAV